MTLKSADRPLRVLFVGNSQFYYSQIPDMVAQISASTVPMECHGALKGGSWLATHLEREETLEALASGPWDVVVLQDHYRAPEPELREKAHQGTQDMVARVRAAGARPILYASPNIEATGRAGFQAIHDITAALAQELDVTLAAAGAACLAAWDQQPDLDLHHTDRQHPNDTASYVGACAIYSAITGRSPVGLPAADAVADLDPALLAALQAAVWSTRAGG